MLTVCTVCAQMAETARLGDLQRDTIIRLRDLYLRNVGILARRRKQLTAALQVGAGLPTGLASLMLSSMQF